jgi:hypothetical protein
MPFKILSFQRRITFGGIESVSNYDFQLDENFRVSGSEKAKSFEIGNHVNLLAFMGSAIEEND